MTQALEGFLQALSAGLLIGAVYGLMCVGLGLIFGVMRVINFAQGDFMMFGMYAAFYFFTALGVQATFGNTFGPFVAIVLAGPVLAAFGYAVHLALISSVSGTRTSSLEGEGHYAQLILTLGIALILQNAACSYSARYWPRSGRRCRVRPGSLDRCSATSASSSTRRAG